MTAPLPLTHHEILALVEPCSRRGRQVDLAASDRTKRHIAFKPVEHPGDGSAQQPPLHETLLLECLDSGNFRFTRTLRHAASGLQATLKAFGAEVGALLDAVVAVPPAQQFRFGGGGGGGGGEGSGYALAYSQTLDAQRQLVVTQGQARLDGLLLTMEVSSVRGISAEIRLQGPVVDAGVFPQDLLAVQGWNWARLARNATGWHTRVRLRGREPRRSQQAMARLEEAAVHLSRTLAAPPQRFHETHRLARWGVVFRRGIPVLTLVLLGLGLWVVSRLASGLQDNTGVWVLLLHVPTAMLAVAFSLQEMAQFEIPPLPRPLTAPGWQAGAASAASG